LHLASQSKDFWLLVKALKAFVAHPENKSGLLPLSASLPDMHTSTTSYINLQNLYKKQAMADATLFKTCLKEVLSEVGLDGEAISEGDADEFVKHCHTLLCERGSQPKEELTAEDVADDFRECPSRSRVSIPPLDSSPSLFCRDSDGDV
jgi:amyloid beta precursor protein binding protein 1